MDQLHSEIFCEVRFAEDETRESAGRLIATLLTEGIPARDRAEVFERGALRWDETKESRLTFNTFDHPWRRGPFQCGVVMAA